jgi:hypothetical protein
VIHFIHAVQFRLSALTVCFHIVFHCFHT